MSVLFVRNNIEKGEMNFAFQVFIGEISNTSLLIFFDLLCII